MATKNIVPRGNNEGQLGTDSKKWNKQIAVTGSFEYISGSLRDEDVKELYLPTQYQVLLN
jgi:hypothetical protein